MGRSADLVHATAVINARQTARIIRIIDDVVPANARIALLGMAYKAGTPVIEEFAGIDLSRCLVNAGYAVVVHDEKALDAARVLLGGTVIYAETLAKAISGADLIVILTPAAGYSELATLTFGPPPPIVIDCWRLLSASDAAGRFRLIHLGRAAAG